MGAVKRTVSDPNFSKSDNGVLIAFQVHVFRVVCCLLIMRLCLPHNYPLRHMDMNHIICIICCSCCAVCQVGFDETTQKVTVVCPRQRLGDDSSTPAKKRRRLSSKGPGALPGSTDNSGTAATRRLGFTTCKTSPSQTSQLNHSMVSSRKVICGFPQEFAMGIAASDDRLVLPASQSQLSGI